jgi:hypothetical protein
MFPARPIPLIAPRLKVYLGAFRYEDLPRVPKFGAGLVERSRRAGPDFTPRAPSKSSATAIAEILGASTPDECASYFQNSGYAQT